MKFVTNNSYLKLDEDISLQQLFQNRSPNFYKYFYDQVCLWFSEQPHLNNLLTF